MQPMGQEIWRHGRTLPGAPHAAAPRLRKTFKASDNEFDMIETLYGVGYRFKEL